MLDTRITVGDLAGVLADISPDRRLAFYLPIPPFQPGCVRKYVMIRPVELFLAPDGVSLSGRVVIETVDKYIY